MAEITVTPCMRYTQMNEIPAAKRRGDKERKTERQREPEQTITITVFYRLTPRRPWLCFVPNKLVPEHQGFTTIDLTVLEGWKYSRRLVGIVLPNRFARIPSLYPLLKRQHQLGTTKFVSVGRKTGRLVRAVHFCVLGELYSIVPSECVSCYCLI